MTPDQWQTVWRLLAAIFLFAQVFIMLVTWEVLVKVRQQSYLVEMLLKQLIEGRGRHDH